MPGFTGRDKELVNAQATGGSLTLNNRSLNANNLKSERVHPVSANTTSRGGVKSTGRFRRRDLRIIAEGAQNEVNENQFKNGHN